MRYDALVLLLGLFFSASPADAQVSIGIGLPSVSIGINLPSFPELVVVPDYPVYYAPRGDVNLFFYDGMYWAYERDNWYASSWYNGPWWLVGPEVVPVFVLRIPVRYYRHPPVAWVGWRSDGPPRWGERWGHDWERRRSGWDRWDRRAHHAPAPLPVYQRQYSGDRYPRMEQQQVLQREKYRYEPKEPVVREHVQQQRAQSQPGERRQPDNQGDRRQQDNQRSGPPPPAPKSTPAVLRSEPPQGKGSSAPAQPGAPAVKRQKQQPPPVERRQQDKDSQRSGAPSPPQPSSPAVLRLEPAQGKGNAAPSRQVAPAVQDRKQQPQPAPVRNEQEAPKSRDKQDRPQAKGQGKAEKQEPQQQPEQGQERERGQERGQGRTK
jgi:hypothetical protein